MWENILDRFTVGIMLTTLLSVVIPIGIYILNKSLHKYGDPPWRTKGDRKGRTGGDNR